jgi:membrane-associated PAP2 superfamily phosphatase
MERRTCASLDGDFWLRHLLAPILLFVFAASVCELTHVDLYLADHFFDFSAGLWPARDSWWAENLIHKIGRDLIVLIATLSFLGWFISLQSIRLRPFRRTFLYLFLCIILGTGLVTIGKNLSGRHCPWDMLRYGGSVPYTSLLDGTPAGHGGGRCFPAGHAAGGFSLMSLYFALRDRRIYSARTALVCAFLLGAIYGYGQMARGAHFLSHNIWSAMVCWLVALSLYPPLLRQSGQKALLPGKQLASPTS